MHAAIIAINEAIDQRVAHDTLAALQNPAAMLVNLDREVTQQLQDQLHTAKQVKAENARNKVRVKLAWSSSVRCFNSQAVPKWELPTGDKIPGGGGRGDLFLAGDLVQQVWT